MDLKEKGNSLSEKPTTGLLGTGNNHRLEKWVISTGPCPADSGNLNKTILEIRKANKDAIAADDERYTRV
jgi:hypothetical protein